jgi:phosphate transport system substrate-binding protein
MRQLIFVTCVTSALSLLAGCKDRNASATGEGAAAKEAPKTVTVQGAGATFPSPLYQKWMSEYQAVVPSARLNYQAVGSGTGIRQITDGTTDFGASDTPMTDEQIAKAGGGILHIPTTIGAVAVAYNVPEVSAPLRLSAETLTAIYLGDVKSWNDPKLVAENPSANLPAKPITVTYRSDGSGTSAVFTEYLAKVSPAWQSKVGSGTSVKWPAGIGAKGNDGVTTNIKSTPGAIGYVELAYAKQNKLNVAALKNRAGEFVEPTLESIAAAAASSTENLPEDLRVSIVDAAGEKAYPIASFTYILLRKEQTDAAKGEALSKFLWWAVHDGQRFGAALDYAELPAAVVSRVEGKLRSIKAGGQTLLAQP